MRYYVKGDGGTEDSEGEYVNEGPREEVSHGEATGFINCVTFCREFRTF